MLWTRNGKAIEVKYQCLCGQTGQAWVLLPEEAAKEHLSEQRVVRAPLAELSEAT